MNFISTHEALRYLCASLLHEAFICIDTEFQRKTTYFPVLGLIQIATQNHIYIIDPIEIKDLTPLKTFFDTYQGICVMFSAHQDLDMFYHRLNFLPHRIFDVQLALEAMNHPPSTGYRQAVEHYLNITLDKSQQDSDWLQRPLSKTQLTYAANDVIYLKSLYKHLLEKIPSYKLKWLWEDMAFLSSPDTYSIDTTTSYKRLRLQNLNAPYLLRLKYLAMFREKQAIKRDKPRGHILSDAILQDLAMERSSKIPKHYVKPLNNLLKHINVMNLSLAPLITQKRALKQEKAFVKYCVEWISSLYAIHPTYLATSQDIYYLSHYDPQGRMKEGWRYDLLGRYFEKK